MKTQPYCSINEQTIKCTSNIDFDIKSEFVNISNNLNPDEKNFIQFVLEAQIENLPENVFSNITFDYITYINTLNLLRISTKAFEGTSLVIKGIAHQNESGLFNDPPDFDFYAAYSSLINLEFLHIKLNQSRIHEIPDNAFRVISEPQTKLGAIFFEGELNIARIGSKAFYDLPNLHEIDLRNIDISLISASAFDIISYLDSPLNIYLMEANLNINCFEENFLKNSTRPTIVDLGKYAMNNLLTFYLL